MEAAADNMEIRVEDASEAAKISNNGMKDSAKESEVKSAAVEAADYISYAGSLSVATVASAATSVFARAPDSTSSVVDVARIIGYTLILIIL